MRQIAKTLNVSPTTVQGWRQKLQQEFFQLMQDCADRRQVFRVQTPLRYPGGKAKVLDILLPYMPADIQEYREPFIGGGSVFLAMRSLFAAKLQRYWINDIQLDIAHFWQCVQSCASDLVAEVMRLRQSYSIGIKLYQHLVWNFDTNDPLQRAARFFILNRITFSGVVEAGGYSESAFQQRFTESAIEKLPALARLMEGVNVTCGSYETLLHAPGEKVFCYLDPPYLAATPSKLYGNKGELHTGFDHEAFAHHTRTSPHRWLITYDDSPEIRRLFSFAHIREYHCQYGMNNAARSPEAGRITCLKGKELIITNYLGKDANESIY